MAKNTPSEKHLKLSDQSLSFVEKLKLAASYELDYWEDRANPPNVPVTVFRQIISYLPNSITPRYEIRKSTDGLHGKAGEDKVFNFEFPFFSYGRTILFYCKGYFFDKDNLKGVIIQSFRVTNPTGKIIQMRKK